MKLYVAGFMFCKNMVALVKKANPEWQRDLWNGIGGKIEVGETPREAMVREFEEEARVHTSLESWELFCTLTGDDVKYGEEWAVMFFKSFVKLPMTIKGSLIEPVGWHSIHGLPKVVPNLNWLIPYAMHAGDLDNVTFYQRTPV